ncbi:hypothetical protein ABK040_012877 [Willaertia magna]
MKKLFSGKLSSNFNPCCLSERYCNNFYNYGISSSYKTICLITKKGINNNIKNYHLSMFNNYAAKIVKKTNKLKSEQNLLEEKELKLSTNNTSNNTIPKKYRFNLPNVSFLSEEPQEQSVNSENKKEKKTKKSDYKENKKDLSLNNKVINDKDKEKVSSNSLGGLEQKKKNVIKEKTNVKTQRKEEEFAEKWNENEFFDEEEDWEDEDNENKQVEEEPPKIDIELDDNIKFNISKYKSISKNKQFQSIPVVVSYIKEILKCGLARKSDKQFSYITHFLNNEEEEKKGKEEEKDKKIKSGMIKVLEDNKVIEAQLKKQQLAKKLNKSKQIYLQPVVRAELQVSNECVNWVFQENKMKYVGSVGVATNAEEEAKIIEESEKDRRGENDKEEEEEIIKEEVKQKSLDDLSIEELEEKLKTETNLYALYKKYYEEEEIKQQVEEEEKDEETKPYNKTDYEDVSSKGEDPFIKRFYELEQMIEKCKGIPQIAFAGRSNVGKSSLINAITGRNNLKASNKPGETTELSFHRFGKYFSLIDLPGYGFAFSKHSAISQRWTELMKRYFVCAKDDLKVIYLLIDVRLGLKRKDMDMIRFLEEHQVPYQIVFTKCDLVFIDNIARMAFKTFNIDPIQKGFTLNYHLKEENNEDNSTKKKDKHRKQQHNNTDFKGNYKMLFVSSRSKTGIAKLKDEIVLKHGKFDVDDWKRNVRKNVVLFI